MSEYVYTLTLYVCMYVYFNKWRSDRVLVCMYVCMYICMWWTAYLDTGVLHVRVYLLVCGEYAELVLVDARTAGRGYRVQKEFHVLRILHQAAYHNLGMYVCIL